MPRTMSSLVDMETGGQTDSQVDFYLIPNSVIVLDLAVIL